MNLISVTVGPLAAASATNISASQKPNGANAMAMTGALTAGSSSNNIATAQTISGATTVALNGSLASGSPAIAYLPGAKSIQIISAGNDSSITFTVVGYSYGIAGSNSGPIAITEVVNGTNASSVATRNTFWQIISVTTSGSTAGNITIGTNGVATLDKPRRVLFTTGGNDSSITYTVYGTDWAGLPINEAVTGPNATTGYTTRDFLTVTGIWPSAAAASTVTVGTNGIASSRPIYLDKWVNAPTALQVSVTGTVNYTVQQTVEDPNVLGYTSLNWVNHPDSTLVSATSTIQGNYAYAPSVCRLLLNSGTGTAVFNVLQASSVVAN